MRAVTSSRMAGKARVLAVLLLLVFARLATADSSSHNGDNLPPMNPPIILNEDPNTPITYEWPYEGAWPLSDDDDALATAYAADEAAYVLADYAEGVVPEAQEELIAESHRKLAGIDDVLGDIGDWFNGVGNSIRRRILQDDPAPAPGTPAPAPVPAPVTPAPAPVPAPAPTTPTAPTTPAPAPATPAPAPAPKPGIPAPVPAPVPKPGTPAPAPGPKPAPKPTPKPGTPADTPTDTTETTGEVTTRPATNPDVPVTPTDIKPGETVPAAVQAQQEAARKAAEQAAAQAAAGQVVQSAVPADIVSVAFKVPDLTPEDFNNLYLSGSTDTVAQLTGTPADQWKATVAAKTALRSLLQTQPTSVAVSLSILTRNPQLVVYRLAQAPLRADASGCTTELCVRLVAAGVPVLPGTVLITPDYSSVFQFGTPAASQVDVKLAETQRTGAIVGAVVGGVALLILLLFTYKKIINCFRGQINTMKAKTAAKNAAETAKTPEPELPKALDPSDPKAEPPVKFLSLSSSGLAHDIPANLAHNNRMYKQGSGGSNQSSSGIPVGPVTGPAHSVTPWATCEDDSLGRDQTGPVAPTAASLAGVQQGGLYRDSNSFRQWAASAVHTGGSSTPSNTPTSSIVSAHPHSKSYDNLLRPVSPATAADLAAALPGSPISSPMYAPPRRNTSDGSNHSSIRRTTPAAGSPMPTATTVDVVQLQQMLDAYYVEQHQKLALASAAATSGGAPAAASSGHVLPAGVVSMRPSTPASFVAAAGWSASGAVGGSMSGTAPPRHVPTYPRRSMASAPGTPTGQPGLNYSTLRTPTTPGNRTAATSEPTSSQQLNFQASARQQRQ